MKIIVVGCGTSGNHIIPLVKPSLIIDRDIVEERNLERQPLFSKEDLGKPKALVLGEKFSIPYNIMDLDCTNVDLLNADLIIDCTDNLETRFLINDYCKKNNISWIYTGIVGDRIRVMTITNDYCFNCLFTEVKGLDTCMTTGVDLKKAKEMAVIVKEEIEKIKEGQEAKGLFANNTWVKVKQSPTCKTCKGEYEYLEGKQEKVMKYCGSSRYQFKGNFDFDNVKERLHGKGDWFVYEDFYIFKDRVLVKASNEKEAKEKFAKVIGC